MDTIQHNPARLYNCDETGMAIVQHKHTKILGLKGQRQISSLQSTERGSLVTVVNLYESNWTLHFSVTCISKKKIWNKNWWMAHRLDQSTRVIPRVDTERDFFPLVSSFHQTYKADKRRSCYLSTGRALFTHQKPGGHYFSSRESCWHNLPPTSQQPRNSTPG